MARGKLIQLLKKYTKLEESKIELVLEVPPNSEMGDYAFPCFILSKELKKKPDEIAKELSESIKDNMFKKVESKGPYLNIFIKSEYWAEEVLDEIHKKGSTYGSSKIAKQKIAIEFPAPNTNKPLHLGHVRNMLLGVSTSKILEFQGNTVYPVDLVNDRGVHICKSMLAYQKWGDNKEPDKKSDHFVGDFYVMFNQKTNDKLETEAQDMLKLWEEGDKEILALWKKMNTWAIDGFRETYKLFGVKHEKVYIESEHYKKGKEIILEGVKKGIFSKSDDGAIVIDLEKEGLGKKILLRSDGTSVYITQDIYLAKKKFDDFKIDKSIYVVGNEQNYHFKTLFTILKKLEYKFADDCYHLSYGMVNLPEGKLKSREGKIVDADNLFAEMQELAKKEITTRHDNLKDDEIEKRSHILAISAINFYILKFDAVKDFIYNPKESISFEGETGPYIQYTHARLSSILKKYEKPIPKKYDTTKFKTEKLLLRKLSEFQEVIRDASENYRPSSIAKYLFNLCQLTNEYYHKHPILKADEDIKISRIILITAIKQVISSGLNLLNITALDEM